MVGQSLGADQRRQLKDRQKHANDDRADDNTQKRDDKGFDQTRNPRHRSIHLVIIKIGDLGKHLFQLPGFFSDGNHSHHQRREHLAFHQGLRNTLPFPNADSDVIHRFFNHPVSRGLTHNFQSAQNRHAAFNQRRERSGKFAHGHLSEDRAKNRHVQFVVVQQGGAHFRFEKSHHEKNTESQEAGPYKK